MENMDTADKTTPRYGIVGTPYHHMYRVDTIYGPFRLSSTTQVAQKSQTTAIREMIWLRVNIKFRVIKNRQNEFGDRRG